MIIGLLQQKGGAGKTTLALNLAAYYAQEGLSVLLVDADPQGSALAWSAVSKAKMAKRLGAVPSRAMAASDRAINLPPPALMAAGTDLDPAAKPAASAISVKSVMT